MPRDGGKWGEPSVLWPCFRGWGAGLMIGERTPAANACHHAMQRSLHQTFAGPGLYFVYIVTSQFRDRGEIIRSILGPWSSALSRLSIVVGYLKYHETCRVHEQKGADSVQLETFRPSNNYCRSPWIRRRISPYLQNEMLRKVGLTRDAVSLHFIPPNSSDK
jgi:hypothetical protein